MFFVAICWDRAGVGEARERAHPHHLHYMAQHASHVEGGGPLENSDGGTIGTLFFLNFDSEADVRAFLEEEPFHTAGCFEASIVRRYRQMQPAVQADAGQVSAAEADLELKQSGIT